MRSQRTSVLTFAAILLFLGGGVNQAGAQEADRQTSPLAFEVASIKPALTGCTGREPFGSNSLTTCRSLKQLIMLAYDLEDYQIVGGSPWVQSDFYEVIAKAASASSPRQIKNTLQGLLVERFRLSLIRETRTMAGYVMSVEKGSHKLPPQNTAAPSDSAGRIQMGGGEFWARGVTMRTLAQALRIELGSPVVDQTKLEGHYDFKLRFEEGNRELISETDAKSTQLGGSIFTALREIGLRLDARKLPIEVLAIQSAERPSEN